MVSGFFIGPRIYDTIGPSKGGGPQEPASKQEPTPKQETSEPLQVQKPQEPPKVACESGNVLKGAQVTASSTYTHTDPEHNYSAQRIVDGDRSTELSGLHSWANAERASMPQTVTLRFTPVAIRKFVLYTTELYPIRNYDIEVRDRDRWLNVASVRNNTAAIIQTRIEPRTAGEIRVIAHSGPEHQLRYVRINELEAYGCD